MTEIKFAIINVVILLGNFVGRGEGRSVRWVNVGRDFKNYICFFMTKRDF